MVNTFPPTVTKKKPDYPTYGACPLEIIMGSGDRVCIVLNGGAAGGRGAGPRYWGTAHKLTWANRETSILPPFYYNKQLIKIKPLKKTNTGASAWWELNNRHPLLEKFICSVLRFLVGVWPNEERGAGFTTCTAVSHQGAIQIFWASLFHSCHVVHLYIQSMTNPHLFNV